MTSRGWCFTNFGEKITKINECIRYLIEGAEVCPTTQKEHGQGYVEFFNKVGIKKAKELIGQEVHLEKRRGKREEARAYCMKDGKYVEFGDWEAGGQGRRTDLQKIVAKVKEGWTDGDFLKDDPDTIFKYQKFISNVRRIQKEEESRNHLEEFSQKFVPNQFQTEILEHLDRQDQRQITWVVDEKGGRGKSWLSLKLVADQNAIRFTNGKNADISFAYNGQPMVIFDLSRSIEGRVNYDIIEQLKNGALFSAKYESCSKIFKPPKVVVFSNFKPDLSKLSQDRWDIVNPDSPPHPPIGGEMEDFD